MIRFACAMCVGLFALTTLTGCRNRPGNGGNGTDTLPEEIQIIVDDVVAQVEATAQAVAGSLEAFASVDIDPENDTFGDCPEVAFVRENNVSTFSLTFEPGCASEVYDDLSVSGGIVVMFDRTAQAIDAQFDEFTVDGHSTSGQLRVSRNDGGGLRTWAGSIDLSITGIGSVVGDLTLVINVAASTITIQSASLNLTNTDSESVSVDLDGIVIRPVANQSFIPEAGTVTFVVPNPTGEGPEFLTIVIEFDQNSPIDGTVRVTYGDVTVANYPIAGL